MANAEFDRILLVKNPACTRVRRAERVERQLMDSRWRAMLEIMETRHPDEGDDVNVGLIGNSLQAGDLVLSVGGDGLANDVFNGIRSADSAGRVSAGEVSMLPLPTGNGNDLSLSLYGHNILRGRRLRDLLERAEISWLDGMKIGASDDTGERGLEKFVHSYIGLGFTATAAACLNEDSHRELKSRKLDSRVHLPLKLLDTIQVIRVLREGLQPFEYRNGSEKVEEAQERVFAVRPRMAAGVVRMKTDPFDGEMIGMELAREGFVFGAVRKVVLHRLVGGIKCETITEPSELTLLTDTPIQYDGEPDELAAGTVVNISHQLEVVRAVV